MKQEVEQRSQVNVLAPGSIIRDEKFGLYAMVFLANMGWGVMAPILGVIRVDFGVSVAEVALANSAFGLARLALDLPIGLIVDRIDQRILRFTGAFILAVGSVVCALAPDFGFILLGRFVTGVGGAIIQVTNLVWISRLSTDDRRGRDLGIYQAILQAGASISPMASGLLADWTTWRMSFWFSAVMALFAFVPMLSPKNDWVERVRQRTNEAFPIEPVRAPREAHRSSLAALFVVNVITFVLFFSVGGFQNTVIPLYGNQVLSLDAGAIGLALGISMLVRFATSIIGGELSDRYGRRVILVPGLFLIGLGTLMLIFATDLIGFWIAIMVLSIGRFGNNVPATVLADLTPANRWGVMLGLNRAIGDLGAVFGPIAMGLLLENYAYGGTILANALLVWVCIVPVIFGIREVRNGSRMQISTAVPD